MNSSIQNTFSFYAGQVLPRNNNTNRINTGTVAQVFSSL